MYNHAFFIFAVSTCIEKYQRKEETKEACICRLARENKERELKGIGEAVSAISTLHGSENPFKQLATEGNTKAVELLLKIVNEDELPRNYAAFGYALGGHKREVDTLLAKSQQKNMLSYVIAGYAENETQGAWNEVLQIINNNPNKQELADSALGGAARKGNKERVKYLLAMGADVKMGLCEFAVKGEIETVEELFFETQDLSNCGEAVETIAIGCISGKENPIRVLARIANNSLREAVVENIENHHNYGKELLNKVNNAREELLAFPRSLDLFM